MPKADTEIHLRTWRSGSTAAERLAAALLRLEGYSNVEPQAPLGGPDDRADILCDRGGYDYVAAVYFPPTEKDYRDLGDKFAHDLEGALRRSRSAFAFFTNQRLTRGQRQQLKDAALERGLESEIYDVERIGGMLEEPAGYGLRAAFLGITMSDDEQIAYFARRDSVLESVVDANTTELRRLAEMISRLQNQSRYVAQTMRSMIQGTALRDGPPPYRMIDPLSLGELVGETSAGRISDAIDPALLLAVHRLVGFELPSRTIGRFRTSQVSVMNSAGEEVFSPPPPDQVPASVEDLCKQWRTDISSASSDDQRLEAVARFHHALLSTHPFQDGNGRVARAVLLQQCIDFFGQADMSRFDRGEAYRRALADADKGDLERLKELIRAVVID